jgi:hypothetical protein
MSRKCYVPCARILNSQLAGGWLSICSWLSLKFDNETLNLCPYLGPLNRARSPHGLSILHHGAIHIRLLGRGNEIELGKLAEPPAEEHWPEAPPMLEALGRNNRFQRHWQCHEVSPIFASDWFTNITLRNPTPLRLGQNLRFRRPATASLIPICFPLTVDI